jgi:hypothetical protein
MTQDRLDRAIYVLDTLLRRELAQDVREALTIVLEAVERMRKTDKLIQEVGDTMATIHMPDVVMSHTEYTIQLVAKNEGHGAVVIEPWAEGQEVVIKDQVSGVGERGPRTDAIITVTGVSGEGQA